MTPIYRGHCSISNAENKIHGRVVDMGSDFIIVHCNERYIRVYGHPIDGFHRGDIVAIEGKRSGDSIHYRNHEILVRPADDPVGNPESIYNQVSRKRHVLVARNNMLRTIRKFFDDRGFMEIHTPTLVFSPGLEPTLGYFSTTYVDGAGRTHAYTLPTSPEFALKKVLTAGFDLIYEIKSVFRNLGEFGAAHNPEFSMLEWYRAFADYTDIMYDIQELICAIARELCPEMSSVFRGCALTWEPPYERISISELWHTLLDVDLGAALSKPGSLKRICTDLISTSYPDEAHAADLFHRVMIEHIEPTLGLHRPIIVHDYPSELAALSVIRNENRVFCERFELYVGGIEIANAFTELNDPREMAIRIRHDRSEQRHNGLPVMPADGALLRAMRQGMPPSAGIALGLERLLMVLIGAESIHECMTFSLDSITGNRQKLSSLA